MVASPHLLTIASQLYRLEVVFRPYHLYIIAKEREAILLSFSKGQHLLWNEQLQVKSEAPPPMVSYWQQCISQWRRASQNRPFPAKSPLIVQASHFQRLVWQAISDIQPGQTKTYGHLAEVIGKKGAARAVGQACNKNPLPLLIPCHRVVGSNGLGGFAGGRELKRTLLAEEGVRLKAEG